MPKLTEQFVHPIPLLQLEAAITEFAEVAGPGAEITIRRVGRDASPVEIACEWEREPTEAATKHDPNAPSAE